MIIDIKTTTNSINISEQKTITVSGVGIQGAKGDNYVPTGGSTDMILAKNSNADHDLKWTSALENITIDASSNGGYF